MDQFRHTSKFSGPRMWCVRLGCVLVSALAPLPAAAETTMLMSSMWKDVVKIPPVIMHVYEPEERISRLMQEQDRLFMEMLDAGPPPPADAAKEKFSTPLALLIGALPDPAKPMTRYRGLENRSKEYAFEYEPPESPKIRASTSPDMLESVRALMLGAEVGDLRLRLTTLEGVYKTWKERTQRMNVDGAQANERKANQHYLEALNRYMKQVEHMVEAIDNYEAELDLQTAVRERKFRAWERFERRHLGLISNYLRKHTIDYYREVRFSTYDLPKPEPGTMLVARCDIAGRTLYFDLSPNKDHIHPLRLVTLKSESINLSALEEVVETQPAPPLEPHHGTAD